MNIYCLHLHFITNIKNIKIIFNLGIKTVLYLKYNRINGFVRVLTKKKSGTANLNTASQWSKQEVCFARATRLWLAVNHNTSGISGEWIWCPKRIAQASERGSCQSSLCYSWGYERLQKSKDSLKDCFKSVNIVHVHIMRSSGGSRGDKWGSLEPPLCPLFLKILWKWNNLVSVYFAVARANWQ